MNREIEDDRCECISCHCGLYGVDRKLRQALAHVASLSPEDLAEMMRKQRESFARAEMKWPRPKCKIVNGVIVYDSYEDYCA
jgi:hypothetical protein